MRVGKVLPRKEDFKYVIELTYREAEALYTRLSSFGVTLGVENEMLRDELKRVMNSGPTDFVDARSGD